MIASQLFVIFLLFLFLCRKSYQDHKFKKRATPVTDLTELNIRLTHAEKKKKKHISLRVRLLNSAMFSQFRNCILTAYRITTQSFMVNFIVLLQI